MNIGNYEYNTNDKLGNGGNADVYLAKKKNSDEKVALKILRGGGRYFEKKLTRFKDEIKIVKKNQKKFEGIIPIIDFDIDDEKRKYWYTMPIATPLEKKILELKINDIDGIVKIVIELSNHLASLHEIGIYHRDIKPSNIYYYEGRYSFGDFGLVDYPRKDEITDTKESVGPKATIAPEMKWDSTGAEGSKADVYSMAKTLWMLLMKSTYSFEGIYDRKSKRMGLRQKFPKEHLVELEELLLKSSQDFPEERPTMKEFSEKLSEYLEIKSDYKKYNRSQWNFVQRQLFSTHIPEQATWTNINSIIFVLNLISEMPSLNHMFYPSGGGNDLVSIEKAAESGFIKLVTSVNSIELIKPCKLFVENFDNDFDWSYFRLDTEEILPINDEKSGEYYQPLTEDTPGHYVAWTVYNYRHYDDGTPAPDNASLVNRYTKGSFVFFAKNSLYNNISVAYNGYHNLVDAVVYRSYVDYLRKGIILFIYLIKKDLDYSVRSFLNDYANLPFEDLLTIEDRLNPERAIIKLFQRKNETSKDIFLEEKDSDLGQKKEGIDITDLDLSVVISNETGSGEATLEYSIQWGRYFCKDSEIMYLNKNGKFSFSFDDKYVTNSLNHIITVLNECNEKVYPNSLGRDISDPYFEVIFKRVAPPNNLFTKSQIRNVLLHGNDRQNNTLVIDSLGNPKLINSDDPTVIYYPVRLESFQAYNNYVGRFSNLLHLNDSYLTCLRLWADHLENDKFEYLDYYPNVDEKQEISRIRAFMTKIT